jgi:hypothetical protein
MTPFERAARERWAQVFGASSEGCCEECGAWIDPRTVPHHRKGFQGGIGGRRHHDPDGLIFLCDLCHRSKHG